MRSKQLVLNLSTSVSSTLGRCRDKEPQHARKSPIEEDLVKNHVEIQSVRQDLSKLETMTVQQLREMMRSVGIPTKGSKRDLVSALKCFLVNQEDGQSPLVAGEDVSSVVKPMPPKNAPSKRKADKTSFEDYSHNMNNISEASGSQPKKVKGKPTLVESSSLEVCSKTVLMKNNVTNKTNRVSAKREVSLQIQNDVVSSANGVDVTMDSNEPWMVLSHVKPQPGWVPYNPRTMRPPPLSGDTKSMKLMSWNVNGLRALLKLEGFSALQLAQKENFDVLCLQETKLQEKDVEGIKHLIEGYDNSFWTCSVSKLGYSGTAVISRIKPLSVKYGLGILDHDSEGRLVTVEFDTFYLISGYIPNSGDGLRRLSYRVGEWDSSLSNYMKDLEKNKPVILTGDLNCAHQEIDIFNPAGNRRSAGFTNEERESFETNFLSKGFVDTFRQQHPGVVGYTYWGYRHGGRKNNKGWRLDYFLVSEIIANKVHDSYILPDVTGSDHCPIGLILKL
ncbi:apurinic endonuclease-redox protein isoform X2 [Tasmannia lanceolata]